MKRWLTLFLCLILLTCTQQTPQVFRLHILANSDSQEDQAVKLKVRDAVIDALGEMDGAQDRAQAEAYITAHQAELIAVANQVLAENGFDYTASAEIGTFAFPEKTYNDVTFLAGDYRALRIRLGQAQGQNWWCVLFPPLCLVQPTQVEPDWQPEDGVEYQSWFSSLFGG